METFPVRSKRFERVKNVQTVQHVVAAILLITKALDHLGEHVGLLPVLELIAGATLIAAAIIDKVRKKHSRVGWVELAGALMLYVEAISNLRTPHTLAFRIVGFIPPTMLLMFGLFEERLRKRPYLGVDDEGFEMRLRLLWKRRVRFNDIERYRIADAHLHFERKDGRVISLRTKDIENHAEAMEWVAEQFGRRGLSQ